HRQRPDGGPGPLPTPQSSDGPLAGAERRVGRAGRVEPGVLRLRVAALRRERAQPALPRLVGTAVPGGLISLPPPRVSGQTGTPLRPVAAGLSLLGADGSRPQPRSRVRRETDRGRTDPPNVPSAGRVARPPPRASGRLPASPGVP